MSGGYRNPAIDRHTAAVAHATDRPEPVDPMTLTPAEFAALPSWEKHRIHQTDPGIYAQLADAARKEQSAQVAGHMRTYAGH